jgi:hypothetical protein
MAGASVKTPVAETPPSGEVIGGDAPTHGPYSPEPELLPRPEEPAFPDLHAPTYLPLGAEPLLPIIMQRPKKPAQNRPGAPALTPASAPPGVSAQPQPESLVPALAAWLKPAQGLRSTPPTSTPGRGMKLLLGINRSFDRGTMFLGPFGRWLRSGSGRSALGWTGLGLLGAALVWAALRFLC